MLHGARSAPARGLGLLNALSLLDLDRWIGTAIPAAPGHAAGREQDHHYRLMNSPQGRTQAWLKNHEKTSTSGRLPAPFLEKRSEFRKARKNGIGQSRPLQPVSVAEPNTIKHQPVSRVTNGKESSVESGSEAFTRQSSDPGDPIRDGSEHPANRLVHNNPCRHAQLDNFSKLRIKCEDRCKIFGTRTPFCLEFASLHCQQIVRFPYSENLFDLFGFCSHPKCFCISRSEVYTKFLYRSNRSAGPIFLAFTTRFGRPPRVFSGGVPELSSQRFFFPRCPQAQRNRLRASA